MGLDLRGFVQVQRSRKKSVEIGRLIELETGQCEIDISQQAAEYAARAHLDEAANAPRGQIADRLRPTHRIRHLLEKPLSRFRARANFAGLPVINQGAI